jgi:hypothetical protein
LRIVEQQNVLDEKILRKCTIQKVIEFQAWDQYVGVLNEAQLEINGQSVESSLCQPARPDSYTRSLHLIFPKIQQIWESDSDRQGGAVLEGDEQLTK